MFCCVEMARKEFYLLTFSDILHLRFAKAIGEKYNAWYFIHVLFTTILFNDDRWVTVKNLNNIRAICELWILTNILCIFIKRFRFVWQFNKSIIDLNFRFFFSINFSVFVKLKMFVKIITRYVTYLYNLSKIKLRYFSYRKRKKDRI